MTSANVEWPYWGVEGAHGARKCQALFLGDREILLLRERTYPAIHLFHAYQLPVGTGNWVTEKAFLPSISSQTRRTVVVEVVFSIGDGTQGLVHARQACCHCAILALNASSTYTYLLHESWCHDYHANCLSVTYPSLASIYYFSRFYII